MNIYLQLTDDKKFAFYPDLLLWEKWINIFNTYLIYKNNKPIGVVSLNTIHCIITSANQEGRIANPIICNGDTNIVLPVLLYIVNKLSYDVIYFHQYGDVTVKNMESINCIKTESDMWFSLYNNRIKLELKDISVPLF